LLDDPDQFRSLLETVKQLKKVLDANGFGDLLKDPKGLGEILARYNGLKKACDEWGFEECFEDPYTMKGFLRNYSKVREAFRATGLEYLLDSSPAMREFLAKFSKEGAELKEVRDKAAHLEGMEKLLLDREEALRKAQAEIQALKAELEKYTKVGSAADFARFKEDSDRLKMVEKKQRVGDKKARELEDQLLAQEKEKEDALNKFKVMFDRFKELDIFKLDVIAREMKAVLGKVQRVEKETKKLKDDASRFKDFSDKQQAIHEADEMQDQCKQTMAHIHDVILKCLNEKQRMHIGVATDNEFLADDRRDGRLTEGGSMIYSVKDEIHSAALASLDGLVNQVERADHGSSIAAKASRSDAVRAAPDQYRLKTPAGR